ncbi:hypothetical protein H7J88_20305 [Mycolicibacterium flavescens]|uniref:Uncharacterized protein n=1 Tax=Mycolicibacterium flavescens TaxID=1776 RepID=A0A1E3RLC8_MYCFV|nr:hypothetical protein [Mycolicibacterium flavescens]MCV7281975.1 hypothetical protein [Mycolicibacterium flavescens]ODQ90660.1 hypothetical protein BHQ18_07910 [Mycolicibacterium flavescens]
MSDGYLGDVPWASVFDPAANARALSAIQAEGFRAASQLMDRFVGATGTAGTGDGTVDYESLVRSWWTLIGQLVPVPPNGTGARADLDLAGGDAGGDATDVVRLSAGSPGVASTEVWLHNRTDTDRGEIRLLCGDLVSHTGAVLAGEQVSFDPPAVPMPPRCSRGVVVTIAVAEGYSPGPYRGVVLAQDHPDLWLPAALTVSAPAS